MVGECAALYRLPEENHLSNPGGTLPVTGVLEPPVVAGVVTGAGAGAGGGLAVVL